MIPTFSAHPLGDGGALATPGQPYDMQKTGITPSKAAVYTGPKSAPPPNFFTVRKWW